MGRKEKIFNKYVKNANESDVAKIDKNLERMKKGPVQEIWQKVEALYKLIKDPKAAWGSKALAIGALIYLISPMDAIPDVIPIVGLIDDVAIITFAVTKLINDISKYLADSHFRQQ